MTYDQERDQIEVQSYAYYQPPLRRQDRLKPNGKHYFTARTVLVPLLFYFVHMGLQTMVMLGLMVVMILNPNTTLNLSDYFVLIDLVMEKQAIVFVVSGSLSIIIYAIALGVFNKREPSYLMASRPSVAEVGGSVAMSIGAIGATTLVLILIQLLASKIQFWSTELDSYMDLTQAFGDGSGMLLQILAFAVIVPIAEELLFRGIVCGELKRVFPDWLVIVLSGVFFAIIHMNVIQSTYVLVAGLLLSAIYVWSGSIYLSILMHMVYNFLGSSLGLLVGDNERAMLWVNNIQLLFVPVAIFIAILFYRRHKLQRHAEV